MLSAATFQLILSASARKDSKETERSSAEVSSLEKYTSAWHYNSIKDPIVYTSSLEWALSMKLKWTQKKLNYSKSI